MRRMVTTPPDWDQVVEWMRSVYRGDPATGAKLLMDAFGLCEKDAHAVGRGELGLTFVGEDG